MLTCSAPLQSFRHFAKLLSAVLDRHSTKLPQKNVRLEGGDGKLMATVTDGKGLFLTMELPAEGSLAPELLPGEPLLAAIKGTRSLAVNGGEIRTDSGVSQLELSDLGIYFILPKVHQDLSRPEAAIPFTPEALAFGAHAASPDPTKPTLSGVMLDLTPKSLVRIVSTDGMRMAVSELKTMAPKGGQYVIPAKACRILQDLVTGSGEAVLVRAGSGHVSFQGKAWRLTTKVVEGTYPEYTRVLPTMKDLPQVINFKRKAFLEAVTQAAKARDDYNENIQMFLSDGHAYLELQHCDGPVSSAMTTYDRKGDDVPMTLAFHRLFLQDIASLTPGKALRYHFVDDIRQGVFTHEAVSEGWNCRTTLMPVRFHTEPVDSAEEAIRQRVRDGKAAQACGSAGLTTQADPKLLKQVGRVLGMVLTRRRTCLPILQRAHLSGEAGTLKVSITDLDVTFSAELPCTGEQDPVLVEGGRLRSLLLDAWNISLSDGVLKTPSFQIKTESAEDFPLLPELHTVPDGKPLARIPFTKEALAFGSASCAQKYVHSALTGVLLEVPAEGGAALVSSDGFRLNVATLGQVQEEQVQGPMLRVLLPRDLFPMLQVLLAKDQEVTLSLSDGEATFRGRGWTLTARRIEKAFPSYRKALPDPSRAPEAFQAPKKAFQEALEEISKAVPRNAWRTPAVEWSFQEGRVVLALVSEDERKEASFPIECGRQLEGLRFDLDHLKGVVAGIPGSAVLVSYGDGTPWTFRPAADGPWVCRGYLMPDRAAGEQTTAA